MAAPGIPLPGDGRGDARYRKTAPFRAQFIYLGGVVESAGGGGVAVPLLSAGGVVDGLD